MNREYALMALITLAVAFMMTGATLPYDSNVAFWVVMVTGYLALSILAALLLHRRQRLVGLLRLRGGDLTLGIVSGLVVAGAAFFALRYLAPLTTPRGAWLLTLYAQVGDVQAHVAYTIALLAIVVGEELVWRGLVQTRAVELWGPKVAIPITSLLYAAAHIPTAVTLAVPGVGYNPLLVLGALGMGFVWGIMFLLTERLAPAIVCHLVFSYFVAGPTPEWLF